MRFTEWKKSHALIQTNMAKKDNNSSSTYWIQVEENPYELAH